MALTDALVSYWALNEFSNGSGPVTRNDSHSTNHLGDANNTPSTTGLVYSLAASCVRANGNGFFIADNASLSLGTDTDVTVAAWVKLTSKPGRMSLGSKGDYLTDRSYVLEYDDVGDRFTFLMWEATGEGTLNHAIADTLGSPATGVWYFVVGWRGPSDGGVLHIQVNNGGVDDSSTLNDPTFDDNGEFDLALTNGDGASNLNGVLGPVMVWKRGLTSGERTQLWNGSAGLPYEAFGAAGLIYLPVQQALTRGRDQVIASGSWNS